MSVIFIIIHFSYNIYHFFVVVPNEVRVEAISSTQLVEGDTITLTCTVDGSWPEPSDIQWLKDGIPFLDSSDRLTINTLPPTVDSYGLFVQTSTLNISDTHTDEDSGVYTCKVFLRIPGVPTISADLSITVQGINLHSLLYFFLLWKNNYLFIQSVMSVLYKRNH